MREFSALQLKAYLEECENQPLLLDVRQPGEFDVCKIENSILVPISEISVKAKALDFERETVVICHHGIRSRSIGRYA